MQRQSDLPEGDAQTSARVLVVDDDVSVRRFLSDTLRLEGYDCVEAGTAREALDLIDDSIAAVVLDNRLPDAYGTELLPQLRARASVTLPVLLVTGDDQVRGAAAGLGAGATDFLMKPVDPDELVARLDAHLRGQAAWHAVLDDQLRRRAAVVTSLYAIAPSASAEDTANEICDALAPVAHLDGIAVCRLDESGRVVVLASRGDRSFANAVRRLTSAPRAYVLARSDQPWIELPDPGATSSALRLAVAPMRLGGITVGLFVLGSSTTDSMAARARRIDELLAEAIDFAGVATGLLGLTLHVRAERERRRFDLAELVRHGRFATAFQPMVELQTGTIQGYEALTRFGDGSDPETRFTEAAALGLGVELELATLAIAVEASVQLPAGTFVSVNMTPGLVLERCDAVGELLHDCARPVVIELTEHDAVDDYVSLRAAIRSFDPEVGVSIDDAGAGFASLRHVVMLEPDFVKLDRSWVTDIDSDETRQAMVAGLSHFARTTGCDLVAEGIESAAERDTLLSLDVRLGQGYLLGAPSFTS